MVGPVMVLGKSCENPVWWECQVRVLSELCGSGSVIRVSDIAQNE